MNLFEVKWRYADWDEYENQYEEPKFFRCFVYAENPKQADEMASKEFKSLVGVPDMTWGEEVLYVTSPTVVLSETM
jgi:hypothetical protein